MKPPAWRYMGGIDCFGVAPEQRDALFARWAEHAAQTGGELQISALDNQFDTDRYQLHAVWTAHAEPFADWVARLVKLLPDDHVDMVIQGFFPDNMEREDLVVSGGSMAIVPWVFKPAEPVPYDLSLVDDHAVAA